MRGMKALVVSVAVAMAVPAWAAEVTVLTASKIHTMNVAQPRAQAMAFDDSGKILAVGDADALLKRYPKATRLDAGKSVVIPGLIDAHGHVSNLGWALMRADLIGASSKEEIVSRLKKFAHELPAGAWLEGRGWDQNLWPEKQFPTAADLDAAFPDRPVWLRRVDGHAAWGNSAALRALKRDLRGGWQPEGGKILRDVKGNPTGVFIDDAMHLVDTVVPAMDDATSERSLELGMKAAVGHGLTGVHDAGVSLEELKRYQRLADRGAIPMRVSAMADGNGAALERLCTEGLYAHPSGRLEMRMVKIFTDGALGSRGAAMLADYSDDRGNRGLMRLSPEELQQTVDKARRCNVQAASHAIGDRGNRDVLDAYAKALGSDLSKDHRWRIEHAQIIAPEDLPRLARMGVIASMQPTHATSDMPWAEGRVGPQRIVGAYAWRQLRDTGARLALGSDFPVESVDPRLGLYAAITRSDGEGLPVGGWHPEEKLTAYEALRGFTLDAAYAGFAETEVGSLAVGKRADFVLLTQDPLAVEPAKLRELTVQATYVDGRAVYQATSK